MEANAVPVRRRSSTRWARRALVVVMVGAVAYLLVLLLLSGPIVDQIYANVSGAIESDSRELPPAVVFTEPVDDGLLTLGGRGEPLDCSIPSLTLPAFRGQNVAEQFRQACIRHDFCYRHGAATYGLTQADCDHQLQDDAFRVCRIVYDKDSIDACETSARKVLMGVRLGGFRSFRAVGAETDADPVKASTYFEYDPLPKSDEFMVVRVAPSPGPVGQELPKSLYFFVVRPRGVRVRVVGIARDGALIGGREAFVMRAAYHWRHAAPMQVGDGFAWWLRASLDNTDGRGVFVAASAPRSDWRGAFLLGSCNGCDPDGSTMTAIRGAGRSAIFAGLGTRASSRTSVAFATGAGDDIEGMRQRRAEAPGRDPNWYPYHAEPLQLRMNAQGEWLAFATYQRPGGATDLLTIPLQEQAQGSASVSSVATTNDRAAALVIADPTPTLFSITSERSNARLHFARPGQEPKVVECPGLGASWLQIPPRLEPKKNRLWVIKPGSSWQVRVYSVAAGGCSRDGESSPIPIPAAFGPSALSAQSIITDLDQDGQMDLVIAADVAMNSLVRLDIMENRPRDGS